LYQIYIVNEVTFFFHDKNTQYPAPMIVHLRSERSINYIMNVTPS